MWRTWIGFSIGLWACQRPPSWLAEAPLIGHRVRDDAGRVIYVPQPPRHIGLATPQATFLWTSHPLLQRHLTVACAGEGEDSRRFFLPCEDTLAVREVLTQNALDWIWVPETLPGLPKEKQYVFAPKTLWQWLRHRQVLAEIYDLPDLRQETESLQTEVARLAQQAQAERLFRVLVVSSKDSGYVPNSTHPISELIKMAGGTPLPRESLQIMERMPPEILILPAGKTDLVNALLYQYPHLYISPALQHQRVFSLERWMIEEPMRDPVTVFLGLLKIIHPEVGSHLAGTAQEVEKPTE
ncbi:MAG: hypothetical protein ABDH91_03885 [Bacteroidia bacterium]